MSDIGPALPPHLLARRKRQHEDREAESRSTTESSLNETAKKEDEPEKRRRVIGPSLPPHLTSTSRDESSPTTALEPHSKPSHPPLDKSDSTSDSNSDDDDDDDFGPAPPSTNPINSTTSDTNLSTSPLSSSTQLPKLKRDDWMTLAPSADGLTRLDPARPRPRAFNTGKSARAPNSSSETSTSLWNETPEQKRQRLQDEIMGVPTQPTPTQGSITSKQSKKEDDGAQKRIRDQINKSRGPSLMDQHQTRQGAAAADDDPSKRTFDREKDMGSGMRIGQTQRQQFLNQAASSVSSKFAGGGYL